MVGFILDERLVDQGIDPFSIAKEKATEIMQLYSRLFILLTDDGNVELAKILFPAIAEK